MEVPKPLRDLYKHWEKHTAKRQSHKDITLDNDILLKMIILINERLSMYKQKVQGNKPPYTSNPILSTYRFCNIYRECDRQTIFYHQLLKPIETNFSLWLLNMLFCRSICHTDTIQRIGLLSFDQNNNEIVYKKLSELPSPKYGTAYIFPISTIQKSKWNTREKFFCLYYPHIVPLVANAIQKFNDISVVEALKRILPLFGFNLAFLWTEVLIDIAYQYPDIIDLYKDFPIGPGSKPTMNMLNSKNLPEVTNLNLVGLCDNQLDLLTYNGNRVILSAENWEGIGCEFRKYTNLASGIGRKRLYSPRTSY